MTSNLPDTKPPSPSSGRRPFRWGEGRISGYLGAFLGVGALLGVLCFRFPELLTTAEFRSALYSFEFARNLLWLAIVLAFTFGVVSFVLNIQKRLAVTAIASAWVAVLLGAFQVQPVPVGDATISFGLDWFLLSLVFSMLIFIPLEKAFARHPRNLLRPGWRTDLLYFLISHLLIQFFLLFTNAVQQILFGWAESGLTHIVQTWPVWVQFIACVVIADLCQVLTHRAFHQVPWLWKFHSVHHSSEAMDWLAGSRTHIMEAFVTRTIVIVPLYVIGFAQPALDAYVVLVGVQAVFVHANVSWDFGPLKYLLVTPQYHHWHHSDDPAYANANFAVHLPVVDALLGSYKLPAQLWPDSYGVFSAPVPPGFIAQFLHPFKRSRNHSATE